MKQKIKLRPMSEKPEESRHLYVLKEGRLEKAEFKNINEIYPRVLIEGNISTHLSHCEGWLYADEISFEVEGE